MKTIQILWNELLCSDIILAHTVTATDIKGGRKEQTRSLVLGVISATNPFIVPPGSLERM